MQVAEQTILEVENAGSTVKLKWGGSEARNRRRLPASDDVETLLEHVRIEDLFSARLSQVTRYRRMVVWANTHFSLFAVCWTLGTSSIRGRKSTCMS